MVAPLLGAARARLGRSAPLATLAVFGSLGSGQLLQTNAHDAADALRRSCNTPLTGNDQVSNRQGQSGFGVQVQVGKAVVRRLGALGRP